jgi:pantetheine-phosphate adenylyltransferase
MHVLFPGSFDPPTLGHLALLRRAAALFDRVTVGIFVNPEKNYLFSLEERREMLRLCTKDLPSVSVDTDDGYVADYCKRHKIPLLIRGIRSGDDLPFERMAEAYNRERGIETLLFLADDTLSGVSPSEVRRRITEGEELSSVAPAEILPILCQKQKELRAK